MASLEIEHGDLSAEQAKGDRRLPAAIGQTEDPLPGDVLENAIAIHVVGGLLAREVQERHRMHHIGLRQSVPALAVIPADIVHSAPLSSTPHQAIQSQTGGLVPALVDQAGDNLLSCGTTPLPHAR